MYVDEIGRLYRKIQNWLTMYIKSGSVGRVQVRGVFDQ